MCAAPEVVTVVLPVNADPGASPISPPAVPLMVVGPVLVIVVAARTPNDVVVPWLIVGPAALDQAGYMKNASNGNSAIAVNTLTLFSFFMLFRFCCVSGVRHIGFKPLA